MTTELTQCNNIWSYIRYRIPPSVVALKFSHGLVINFFLCIFKIRFHDFVIRFFLIFQNFWIFQLFSKCSKIWKIQKIVNDEITKPIFENLQKSWWDTHKIFKKFKKSWWPTYRPTDRQTYRTYVYMRLANAYKNM